MAFGKRNQNTEPARPRSGGWNADYQPTPTLLGRLQSEAVHKKFDRMASRWGLALFGFVMLFGLAMTLLVAFALPVLKLTSALHILVFLKKYDTSLNWIGMGFGLALMGGYLTILVLRSIATITRPNHPNDASQVFRRNPQIWFWGLMTGVGFFFIHTGTTLEDMAKSDFWSLSSFGTFNSNGNGQGSTPEGPNLMVFLEHLILPLMAARFVGLGYERWVANSRGGNHAR